MLKDRSVSNLLSISVLSSIWGQAYYASDDSDNDGGFTLVEVLISIFIFSLISVASIGALTSSLQGKARLGQSLDQLSQLQQMRALVSSDISSIIRRQNRDVLGGFDPVFLSGGYETLIEFTRGGRDNPGFLMARSDLQRVSYIFEKDQLIRRVMAHENPSPQAKTSERVLLSGLKTAKILFHTDKLIQDRIELNIKDQRVFPDMIELRVEYESGDRLTQYFELSL